MKMNLGDPELELVDPTPNVHLLFIHFDKMFFWTKLASRAVVRWSKRMYSCAGICSYEGRGGLCDIALSEPLLKLRPRKDLVETLLHEMIHAFLFVTNRDQDRDGHGPNFQAHMHRINQAAGLKISIYHSFHDEVELYQTHWWRCNGPCQSRRPHFGIVRRSMNKAPGPSDYWWKSHIRNCGGTFVKIKEPEKQEKVKAKKTITSKPNADITKYITNNIKTINNIPNTCNNNNPAKPILKDSSNVTVKGNTKIKTNSSSTVVVSKKGVVFNPTVPKPLSQPVPVFTGSGHTLNTGRIRSNSVDVTETVRNIWANKEIPSIINKNPIKSGATSPLVRKPIKNETNAFKDSVKNVGVSNPNKHKAETTHSQSPPTKIKKIDDYFKATSVLKDLYGEDYKLTQSNNNNTKLVAVKVKLELVECPVCSIKFSNEEINRHLDECLNKDIIEKLSKDSIESVQEVQPSQSDRDRTNLKEIIGVIQAIPEFRGKPDCKNNNIVDLTNLNVVDTSLINTGTAKRKTETPFTLQSVDITNVITMAKGINKEQIVEDTVQNPSKNNENFRDKRRNTVSFITKDRGDNIPRIKVEKEVIKIPEAVVIKSEPGSSTEEVFDQVCPCCGKKFDKPMEEHLDECLAFFDDNATVLDEGASTSFSNNTTIVIEDDDEDVFDESMTLNATGTKTPCPCCMKMVEQSDMNEHLDLCLQ